MGATLDEGVALDEGIDRLVAEFNALTTVSRIRKITASRDQT